MTLRIVEINSTAAYPFLLQIHYAKRIPSISYAYGLIDDAINTVIGVVTYGVPSSAPLRNYIAGKENSEKILELNRLCLLVNVKNYASMLVARSLRMLPRGRVIVSFADTSQGHTGYVYQACNFGYYGLSEKRTDWKIRGKEHLHSQTIADEFRGIENRSKAIREKYGDDFYLKERSRKHRYIYITGHKFDRKSLLPAIKYERQPYPKAEKQVST